MTSSKLAKVGGILLAAGSSSRLGQSKQLLKVEGKTLLERSLDALSNSKLDTVLTVLGSNAKQHAAVINDKKGLIVINPVWSNGMGSSIKCGVQSILKSNTDLHGILIAVCDQIYLSTNHVDDMISVFYQDIDSNVASEYDGVLGVPVIFSHKNFRELLEIPDHLGAKSLIGKRGEKLVSVPFFKGGIDIDRPDDLNLLIN